MVSCRRRDRLDRTKDKRMPPGAFIGRGSVTLAVGGGGHALFFLPQTPHVHYLDARFSPFIIQTVLSLHHIGTFACGFDS